MADGFLLLLSALQTAEEEESEYESFDSSKLLFLFARFFPLAFLLALLYPLRVALALSLAQQQVLSVAA